MSRRPESVTVIAWLLLVFGVIGLPAYLMAWFMRDWPMLQPLLATYRLPYPLTMELGMLGISIQMLCAVGLLFRLGWARHVYVVTALATTGFSIWAMPTPWPLFAVPGVLIPIVAAVFLYRPAANRWFSAQEIIPAD